MWKEKNRREKGKRKKIPKSHEMGQTGSSFMRVKKIGGRNVTKNVLTKTFDESPQPLDGKGKKIRKAKKW